MSSSSSSSVSIPASAFDQWSQEFQEQILQNLETIHKKIRKCNLTIPSSELTMKVDQVSGPLFDSALLGPTLQKHFLTYPPIASKINPQILSKIHLRQMVVDTSVEIALSVAHAVKELLKIRAERMVQSEPLRDAVKYTVLSEISVVLQVFVQDPLGKISQEPYDNESNNSSRDFLITNLAMGILTKNVFQDQIAPGECFLIEQIKVIQGQTVLGEYFIKESRSTSSLTDNENHLSETTERKNWKDKTLEKLLNSLTMNHLLIRMTNQTRHNSALETRVNGFGDGIFSSQEVHNVVAKFLVDQLDIAQACRLGIQALDKLLFTNMFELVGMIKIELEKLVEGIKEDPALRWSLTAEINETFRNLLANPFVASDITTAFKIHLVCIGNYLDIKTQQPQSIVTSSIEDGFINVDHFSTPMPPNGDDDEKKVWNSSTRSSSSNSSLSRREKLIKEHTLKIKNGFQYPLNKVKECYNTDRLASEIVTGTKLIFDDPKLEKAINKFVVNHLIEAEAFAEATAGLVSVDEGLSSRINEMIMSFIAEAFYYVIPEITLQNNFSKKISKDASDLIVNGLKSGVEAPPKKGQEKKEN